MDIGRGETVEKELDNLITRRSRQKDPDEEHEMYQEGVRRYNARLRQSNRAGWYAFHMDQAERHRRNLAALVAHHEAEAEKLMEPEQRRTA